MTYRELKSYRYSIRHSEEPQSAENIRNVTEFVAAIPDVYVRQIISARYIKRLTWGEIAACFYPNSEDSCRMMVRRYLEKNGVK